MSRYKWPSTEDELRAVGFLLGCFIVAFWAGAGISPNPQVAGIVAGMIFQKVLPSLSRKDRTNDEPPRPRLEVDRSANGDEPQVDRARDGILDRVRARRLQRCTG